MSVRPLFRFFTSPTVTILQLTVQCVVALLHIIKRARLITSKIINASVKDTNLAKVLKGIGTEKAKDNVKT